jgi:hypothetical protein
MEQFKDHPNIHIMSHPLISHKLAILRDERTGTQEFRKKYDRMLVFDPVERTPRWEELYCEVEEECDRQLGDTPKGMGFCFAYWSVRRDVLAKRGIMWQSPAAMNPHVMLI